MSRAESPGRTFGRPPRSLPPGGGWAARAGNLNYAVTLAELNALPEAEFVAAVGPLFEHSPWIAQRAAARRPFADAAALHAALLRVVNAATRDDQEALIRAHPDLADRLSRPKTLTAHSRAEQAAAGLDALTEHEAEGLARLNAHYRERFGFPFVICARNHDKDAIFRAIEERLSNDREAEIDVAVYEIGEIARLRLETLLPPA